MSSTTLWIIYRILFIIGLIDSFYFRFKNEKILLRCKDALFWQLLMGFFLAYNNRDKIDTILNIVGLSVIILFCLFVIELIRVRIKKKGFN